MQRDHGGKRSITVRLVELRMQGQIGRGDIDLMRSGQRRRIRGERRGKEKQRQECGC
jgi:hypothetical protein